MHAVRRPLRTISLFGTLGVLINVVLAWMFAMLGSVGQLQWQQGPDPMIWLTPVPSNWPAPTARNSATARGIDLDLFMSVRQNGSTRLAYRAVVVRTGWPLRSLHWIDGSEKDAAGASVTTIGRRWIALPDWINGVAERWAARLPVRRMLPIHPLWLGFTGNSLLFGGGLWLPCADRARCGGICDEAGISASSAAIRSAEARYAASAALRLPNRSRRFAARPAPA
jgi:hypothetical protein